MVCPALLETPAAGTNASLVAVLDCMCGVDLLYFGILVVVASTIVERICVSSCF